MINGVYTTFVCTGISDSHLGHCFWINNVFCPYYPNHTPSSRTVQPSCKPNNRATIFKCSNYIFSYWILSNSSSIFSYDSVMLAAWTRSTDRNLFPLCRNRAFKLTSEESTNKSHSVGSSSRPRGSIREQTSLQNTSFSWEKKSLN